MFKKKGQFDVLLKSSKLQEKEASGEHNRVHEVVKSRVEELRQREALLMECKKEVAKLDQIRQGISGRDMGHLSLSGIVNYRKRLIAKMKTMTQEIRQQQESLHRAEEREQLAFEDLTGARTEKKKLEHLISRRTRQERNVTDAQEEERTLEHGWYRKR